MKRAEEAPGIEVMLGGDPYRSLAVYPAAEPNGDVLCLMHGGGWTNGYKEWMAFMAPALNARGVTAVSLGYRLAPQHVFPAGYEDCLDGVAWVHGAIAEHGGLPERIFVGGHSAGGHLAALMTLRRDWQAPRGLPPTAIRGALPISGTYLFGPDSGLSMRPRFLGPEGSGTERDASPMTYIRGDAPPFLVAWGEKDFPHLIAQAKNFVEALTRAGVAVESIELAGCDHLGASYASGEPDGAWVEAAVAFMKRA